MRAVLLAGIGLTFGVAAGAWFALAPASNEAARPDAVPAVTIVEEIRPLRFVPCWFAEAEAHGTRCAELAVPERWDAAGSRMLQLKLVVIGPERPDDAIVFVSGGPGSGAGIDTSGIAAWWLQAETTPWLGRREIVVFDQRGAGLSEPDLRCPEIAAAERAVFVADLTSAQEAAAARGAAAACHARLAAAGVDFSGYTTEAMVEDLRHLVGALGLEDPALIATSFGTRIVLTYLRDTHAKARAVVLDSVYPPDVAALSELGWDAADSFAALFRRCADKATCREAAPDSAAVFERVLDRAATRPVPLDLIEPATKQPVRVEFGADKLIETLAYGFYDRQALDGMPAVLAAVDRGHPEALAPLAQVAFQQYGWADSSLGLYLSVVCHDEYPFDPPEAIAREAAALPRFARLVEEDFPIVACPAWPVGAADPATRRPVESDVPALLLSGQFDIVTPPRWARQAAAHMPHATAITLADIGHGALHNHDCAYLLAGRFLDHPDKPVYDDCLLTATPAEAKAGP